MTAASARRACGAPSVRRGSDPRIPGHGMSGRITIPVRGFGQK